MSLNKWMLLLLLVTLKLTSQAQVIQLLMDRNPPPIAYDWLKNPQPIKIIITSPTALGYMKVKVLVTRQGRNVITTNLNSALPIYVGAGTKYFLGTDLWTANSFNVSFSDINLTSGKLKPDDYQICVTLVTNSGTPVGNLSCSNFQITEFQEPTLIYPLANDQVAENNAMGLAFRWTAVTPNYNGLVKYRFELFEIPVGMSAIQAINLAPIEQQTTNITQFLWINAKIKIDQRKKAGVSSYRYVWRVRAIDGVTQEPIGKNTGALLGYSELRELTINTITSNPNQIVGNNSNVPKNFSEPVLAFPINSEALDGEDAYKAINFKWKKVSPTYNGVVTYLFKVWELPSGQSVSNAMKANPILNKEIQQDSSYSWKRELYEFSDKRFVWQVQAIDQQTKKPIGSKKGTDLGFSENEEFVIKSVSLKEPVAIAPAKDGKVSFDNLKSGLKFQWNAVTPNTKQKIWYTINLYEKRNKGVDTLILSRKIKDSVEFTWKTERKNEGNFYWNVFASDSINRAVGVRNGSSKGFSENNNFELKSDVKDDSLVITDCDGNKKVISNKGLARSPSVTDFKNKFVKLNEFSMLIKEASGNSNSLKGRGSIVVSWLKTPLAVEFEGITIDAAKMTVTKGEIFAMQDDLANELPKFLKKLDGKNLTKNDAKKLNAKLKANKATKLILDQSLDKNISTLTEDNTPKLPLGINNLLGYTIAISEMKFTPEKNILVGIAIIPYNKDEEEDVISFAANNIEFGASSPSKGGGQLVLLEDFNIVDTAQNSYGITLKALVNNKPSTYIEWDCKGFKNLKTTVDINFPRNWLTPIKEDGESTDNEKVQGRAIADISNLNDWILDLSLNPCEIQGLDGVELSVKKLVIDNSDSRNADGMKFPSGYTGNTKNDFRGFYLKNAQLTLPKFYNKSTDTTGISIELERFIITKQGISGNVTVGSKENPVVNLSSGTVGDFQASIGSIELDILNKSLKKATVTGQMVLPISQSNSQTPNTLNYEASWTAVSKKKGAAVQLIVTPEGKLSTDLIGGADLKLDKNSTIEITYEKGKTKKDKGKVTSTVKLNGEIALEKKLLNKFDASIGMKFQGLGFEYDNSKTKKRFTFNKGTFAFASPQKKVGGFPVTFTQVSLINDENETPGYDATASLSMSVSLNLGDNISGSTRVLLKGGIKKENNIFKPSFLSADIDSIKIDAKLSAVDLNATLVFYSNNPTYGNGFLGTATANFKKAGMLMASIRFGSMINTNNENYRYWYVDGKIVLKNAIPIIGPLGLKGAGVSAWYHMKQQKGTSLTVQDVNVSSDNTGTGQSGATFTPDNQTLFGFTILGILTHTKSDKTFNGDISLSAEFNTSGGINFLKLAGNGYVGAGMYEREKAPIKGSLVANYDFTQNIFDLNVAVGIKYPPVSPIIETTQDATFNLYVNGKEKTNGEPKWRLTVGTPTSPNQLKYFSINTWAYFRAGNDLVTNSSFQPVTIAGLKGVDPSFKTVPDAVDENAKGGKGLDFGIGFNKAGSVSVGPFSGSYSVGAELNLCMAQYDATNGCVTDKFNYWYARGGIAAWADANVGFKGLINARLAAAALMQAGAPDPIWIKGRVAGKFTLKVIFISININASVPFTYGTVCQPKRPLASNDITEQGGGIEDIETEYLVEIGDFSMHSSGNTDRLTAVPIVSPFELSYENENNTFTLDVMENGVKKTKTYKVTIEWIVQGTLLMNPGAGANWPGSPKLQWGTYNMKDYNGLLRKDGEGYALGTFINSDGSVRNKRFCYKSDYSTYVIATLMVKNANNQWEVAKKQNGTEIKKQTKSVSFRTHN